MTMSLHDRELSHAPEESQAAPRQWRVQRPWLTLGALLGTWVVLFNPFGRHLEWDEAVFYSQSGWLEGIPARPTMLVASREHGTGGLLGIVRTVAGDLATTRLLWGIITFLLVALAFRLVSRFVGRSAALAGWATFVTIWVATIFFTSFFGSLIGAALSLCATALYLHVRADPPERLPAAIGLGLALGGAFWMRHLETAAVAAVIGVHALSVRPAEVWQRRKPVLVAIGTFAVVFVIPWLTTTISRWGSVSARFEASREQTNAVGGDGHTFGLHNGMGDYATMFIGRRGLYEVQNGPPQIVSLLLGAGAVALALLSAWWLWRRRRWARNTTGTSAAPVALITAQAAVGFGLFWFASQMLRERYMMYGLIFASVLMGGALVELVTYVRRRVPNPGKRQALAAVGIAVAVSWLGAHAWVVSSVQTRRVHIARQDHEVGAAAHLLAGGRDCLLLGTASKAQISARSGCTLGGGRLGGKKLAYQVRRHSDRPGAVFVWWEPERDNLERLVADWERINNPAGRRRTVLSYRLNPD